MANLTYWTPWRELEDVTDRLNRIFGTSAHLTRRPQGEQTDEPRELTWAPRVDIVEDVEGYTILAELPGIQREDVKLTVEEGVLKLRGERKRLVEEQGKTFHRVERSFGTFTRTFTLPKDVAADKILAKSKDGVLSIFIPKRDVSEPKGFEITIGAG